MPSGALPVAGSTGICPEAYKKFPTATAWLYGPIAAGAPFVLISFKIILSPFLY